MKRISVKLKITLWYTFIMIIISLIALFAVTKAGHDMAERNIESRLVRVVNDMSKRTIDRSGKLRPVPDFTFFDQGVHLAIYDKENDTLYGNLPFSNDVALEFKNDKLRTETYDGNVFYVYDREIPTPAGNSFWIKGLISKDSSFFGMETTVQYNAVLSLILIIAAAIGGYFIISRAFSPVNKIRKTAKEISESHDLSRRINIGNGRDEISALANTFDEMLSKIEKAFENEKQFTSDASHELRTPVAVILSECEYMAECAKTEEEFKESALSINKQAEKMSKLIAELLTISRMDKNTISLNFEETDISELLTFVCDDIREINKKDIALYTNITPDIFAEVDRSLLARLFINLISNAVQYTEAGGQVKVTLEQKDNIVFSVTDNGIGIAEEDLPKIWERFYQVDNARASSENNSMGLGLSMVKWIAECHKGTLTVKSTLGKGSEFRFEFR